MKIKKTLKTIAFSLFLISPVLALAFPGIPHQFYGSVKFADDKAALDGTVVEAKIGDVSIVTVPTKDGSYGYNPDLFYVTDLDSNNTRSGDEIQFFVNGLDTDSSVVFSNGKIQNLDLSLPSVNIGTSDNAVGTVVTDETVVIVPNTPTVINMGSGDLSVSLSPSGTDGTSAVINKIEKLDSGNIAILSGNNLLNAYEIKVTGNNLTISVTMKYNDSTVDENTIKPYIFDGSNWIEITSPAPTIDKVANTLTFTISSAQTPYAIFGKMAEASSTSVSSGNTSSGGGGGIVASNATTATNGTVIGDINGNSKVDKYDFALMMSDWGETEIDLAADLNNDGKVDKYDFSLLMVNWSI